MNTKRELGIFFFSLFFIFASAFILFGNAHASSESPTIPTNTIFSDVQETHPNYTAIKYLKDNNIVSGYSDGTFKPESTISRGAFAKILIAAKFSSSEIDNCLFSQYKSQSTTSMQLFTNAFPDINNGMATCKIFDSATICGQWEFRGHTFARHICLIKQHGIAKGFSDGTFKPDNTITFGEAAKMISSAFGLINDQQSTDPTQKFKIYIEALAARKAIPTSIVNSEYQITRGEMAEIIYRVKNNITDKESKTYNDLFLNQCNWCGTSCERNSLESKACPAVMPATGTTCKTVINDDKTITCSISLVGNKCAAEGHFTSGTVSPEYQFGCCSGLSTFNTKPGSVGGGMLCYQSSKGNPICKNVGAQNEGWYYPDGTALLYGKCSDSTSTGPVVEAGCKVGGCSGTICQNKDAEDMISTCEWKDSYACYKKPFARCKKQTDGSCGWTQSEDMKSCVGQTKTCAMNGEMCGGIAGILCCSGMTCKYSATYPDASGICEASTITSKQGKVFENEYMKVTIPTDWTTQQVPNLPSALNIIKGKYILYINTRVPQASGITGGRAEEYAGGAPSYEAVVLQHPGGLCGNRITNNIYVNGGWLSINDYFIGPDETSDNCRKPTNAKNVWYLSFIGEGINHVEFDTSDSNIYGWVTTMYYNSKDVNSFPIKGSPELNQAMEEMTSIINTITFKK